MHQGQDRKPGHSCAPKNALSGMQTLHLRKWLELWNFVSKWGLLPQLSLQPQTRQAHRPQVTRLEVPTRVGWGKCTRNCVCDEAATTEFRGILEQDVPSQRGNMSSCYRHARNFIAAKFSRVLGSLLPSPTQHTFRPP
eukprot:1151611-Pelagomonas_calceolata.AAC.2